MVKNPGKVGENPGDNVLTFVTIVTFVQLRFVETNNEYGMNDRFGDGRSH